MEEELDPDTKFGFVKLLGIAESSNFGLTKSKKRKKFKTHLSTSEMRTPSKKATQVSCRVCDKKLFSRQNYEEHFKRFHANIHPSLIYKNSLKCKTCERYFENKSCLSSHISNSSCKPTEEGNKCFMCQKSPCICPFNMPYNDNQYMRQYDNIILEYKKQWKEDGGEHGSLFGYDFPHPNHPQQCQVCERYCPRSKFKSHMNAAHFRYCPICQTDVNGYSVLKKHLKKEHAMLIKERIVISSSVVGTDPDPDPELDFESSVTADWPVVKRLVPTEPIIPADIRNISLLQKNSKPLVCFNCNFACTDDRIFSAHIMSLNCTTNQCDVPTAGMMECKAETSSIIELESKQNSNLVSSQNESVNIFPLLPKPEPK